MPITGISKVRLDANFKAQAGPDGFFRIGSNNAATKLAVLTPKLREALERFEEDSQAILQDPNLSKEGQQRKHSERVSDFQREAMELRQQIDRHHQELVQETKVLRAKTRGPSVLRI